MSAAGSAGQPAVVASAGQADCRIGYCQLWAHPGAALCYSHHRQWKTQGCPDLDAFIGDRDQPAAGEREQADLTALPDRLRLEIQYALQCRHDDNMIKTKPATVRSMIRWVAGSGTASLLDRSERDWRASCPPQAVRSGHPVALLIYAHRKVAALAEGGGWDNEYPRDTWHMRRLGISSRCATLRFAGISQPWLKDLAKRWARWRLSTGLEAQDLLPRRSRAHPDIGIPRRRRRRRARRHQPGLARALPR